MCFGSDVSSLSEKKTSKIICCAIFFLCLCAFIHVLTFENFTEVTIDRFFTECAEFSTGGGMILVPAFNPDEFAEQKKSMAECAYEGIPYPNYSSAELENTAVYRKIAMKLPEYDAFVFHASAVAVGERAYLFTAKSGTGKTTVANIIARQTNKTLHKLNATTANLSDLKEHR